MGESYITRTLAFRKFFFFSRRNSLVALRHCEKFYENRYVSFLLFASTSFSVTCASNGKEKKTQHWQPYQTLAALSETVPYRARSTDACRHQCPQRGVRAFSILCLVCVCFAQRECLQLHSYVLYACPTYAKESS